MTMAPAAPTRIRSPGCTPAAARADSARAEVGGGGHRGSGGKRRGHPRGGHDAMMGMVGGRGGEHGERTKETVDVAATQHNAGPSGICPRVDIVTAALLPYQPGRTRRVHRSSAPIATSRTSLSDCVDARVLRGDVVNSITARQFW